MLAIAVLLLIPSFALAQQTVSFKTDDGGVIVADGQDTLAARGEFGVKHAGLIAGLDDKRLGAEPVRDGGVALACDGGRDGPPGFLLLLGGLFPRWQRPGVGAAVGFVCGLREAV